MKRLSAVLLASLFLLSAAACEKGGNEEKAEKAVKVLEDMANIADKNKDNCDKMSEEMTKYAEANKNVFAELKAAKGSKEEEKKLEEKYKPRLDAAMQKMMGPMMGCPKAAEAMSKIDM